MYQRETPLAPQSGEIPLNRDGRVEPLPSFQDFKHQIELGNSTSLHQKIPAAPAASGPAEALWGKQSGLLAMHAAYSSSAWARRMGISESDIKTYHPHFGWISKI